MLLLWAVYSEIVKVYNKTLTHRIEPKVIEKEDDFYNPAFNFLLDYTLYTISTKGEDWIKDNRALLLSFVKEYATSTATERVTKLDDYAVIPNQNGALCIKNKLNKNVNMFMKKTYVHIFMLKQTIFCVN